MGEIVIEVQGLPPAKSEAQSIFGKSHSHSDRVVTLLRQVNKTIVKSSWDRNEKRSVGLEVLVSDTSLGSPPMDATNILGGVADVLQSDRPRNTDSTHLENMRAVSLYKNDRQIREVRFSVKRDNVPSYRVRVWVLSDDV